MQIAQDLLYYDSAFMKTIIIGNKTLMYGYNLETKFYLSLITMEASHITKRYDRFADIRVMLTGFFFFYFSGIVHHEYAPAGQAINKVI